MPPQYLRWCPTASSSGGTPTPYPAAPQVAPHAPQLLGWCPTPRSSSGGAPRPTAPPVAPYSQHLLKGRPTDSTSSGSGSAPSLSHLHGKLRSRIGSSHSHGEKAHRPPTPTVLAASQASPAESQAHPSPGAGVRCLAAATPGRGQSHRQCAVGRGQGWPGPCWAQLAARGGLVAGGADTPSHGSDRQAGLQSAGSRQAGP